LAAFVKPDKVVLKRVVNCNRHYSQRNRTWENVVRVIGSKAKDKVADWLWMRFTFDDGFWYDYYISWEEEQRIGGVTGDYKDMDESWSSFVKDRGSGIMQLIGECFKLYQKEAAGAMGTIRD
jgi:hypothetical protein